MTDREKAIVMAHTGICMLTGDKFQIFHKYVEDIMGRPVWTHDIGFLENEIKEKSKDDFIALCADEDGSEKLNKWIPVSERLPKNGQNVLFCDIDEDIMIGYHVKGEPDTHFVQDGTFEDMKNVKAWFELPEPYKAEGSEKE